MGSLKADPSSRALSAADRALPGEPFFEDHTGLLRDNPAQKNYGVAVTDID